MNRLLFLGIIAILTWSSAFAQRNSQLPHWQPGYLDIHHISTGRGNAAFLVFPDGTTMLIDAGDISDTHPRTLSARNSVRRPDDKRATHEWIVDYIKQFMPEGRQPTLDYAMITHFHDDHFGEWDDKRQLSVQGGYSLSGITGVGDMIRIGTLIDRGHDFPIDLRGKEFIEKEEKDDYHIVQTLREYWKFIDVQSKKNGLTYQKLKPGARDQIVLKKDPSRYPDFSVRTISVNGQVWTGYADNDYLSLFKEGQDPGENPLSACIKISYGKFDYFTGGDIAGMNPIGESDHSSVEANVAPVIGAVDVATLNHHGNRDSQSPAYVRTVRPRVWIEQVWSSDHPGEEVLRRITSTTLYPGPRDIFTTDMLEANRLVIGDRVTQGYKNQHGHVVVRVTDNGMKYRVYVLNDFSQKREVVDMIEYQSR
jgi:beta-lactamase superfamily II metal-dependent hydrolase